MYVCGYTAENSAIIANTSLYLYVEGNDYQLLNRKIMLLDTLKNKRIRLYSKRSCRYALIFNLRLYFSHQNSPEYMYKGMRLFLSVYM